MLTWQCMRGLHGHIGHALQWIVSAVPAVPAVLHSTQPARRGPLGHCAHVQPRLSAAP